MAGKPVICPACHHRFEDKFRIIGPKLLIVEGRDEEEFFTPLLEILEIKDVQIAGIGGKTFLRARLKALKADPQFSMVISLGIMRDADDDASAAFQSVQDSLRDAGLPFPVEPMSAISTSVPSVTVMILPPNAGKGELEDLCLAAVSEDPAMPCVDRYFECLEISGASRPKKDLTKARARVFLSSRQDPTLAVGVAAKKGYWQLNAAIFDSVKDFLRSL